MALKRISDLTGATLPLGGTEELELDVAGAARKCTAQDIADLASGGDVSGPGSSTDNALPRFDGAGGDTLQNSGVLVSDSDEISGYRGHLNAQTGTSYTLLSSDSGKVVECTNAGAITLDMPNSLPVGFCCTVVQGGAGAITFTPASGASRRNRQSHTKTAGQWAMTTLYVRTNSGGSAAEYVLGGDTST